MNGLLPFCPPHQFQDTLRLVSHGVIKPTPLPPHARVCVCVHPHMAPKRNRETGQSDNAKKAKTEITLDPRCVPRVMKELERCQKEDTRNTLGIEFSLVDEDNPLEWSGKWYYDMAGTRDATATQDALAQQLEERGLKYIEFRMVFPPNYPTEAPFVYNYFPRLVGSYIFSAGGLCAQTLSTKFGWSPASKASYLMLAVRGMLEEAGCRLQRSGRGHCSSKADLERPFCEAGARKDFSMISNLHSRGWSGSAGRS
jgi:ubiquitin-protein ligase